MQAEKFTEVMGQSPHTLLHGWKIKIDKNKQWLETVILLLIKGWKKWAAAVVCHTL